MKAEQLENGNLQISLETDSDKELIFNLMEAGEIGLLSNLFEETGWSTNGRFYEIQPEWIGALTGAPLLTDEIFFRADGTPEVQGSVWWFPNYQVESFAQTLMNTGSVVFAKA